MRDSLAWKQYRDDLVALIAISLLAKVSESGWGEKDTETQLWRERSGAKAFQSGQ